MRKEDMKKQLADVEEITITPRVKPGDRSSILLEGPLMADEFAQAVKTTRSKRKLALPQELRVAIQAYMSKVSSTDRLIPCFIC